MNYQEIFKKIEDKGYRVDNITKFREALKTTDIDRILSELDVTKKEIEKDEEISNDAISALMAIGVARKLLDTDEIKVNNSKKSIDALRTVFDNLELLLCGEYVVFDVEDKIKEANAQIAFNKNWLDQLNNEIAEINSQINSIDENKSLSREEKHASFRDLLIKLEEKNKSIDEVKADIKKFQKERRRLSDKKNRVQKKSAELLNSEDFGGFFKYQDSFGDAMNKLSLPSEISDKLISEFGAIRKIYRKRTNDGRLEVTNAPHDSLDDILSKYGLVQGEQLTETLLEEEPMVVEEPKPEEKKEPTKEEIDDEAFDSILRIFTGRTDTPEKKEEPKEDEKVDSFDEIFKVFNHEQAKEEKKEEMPRSREPKFGTNGDLGEVSSMLGGVSFSKPKEDSDRVSAKDLSVIELITELKKLNPEANISPLGSEEEGMTINAIDCDIPAKDLKLPEGFYYNDKNGITNKHNTLNGSYVTLHVEEIEKGKKPEEPVKEEPKVVNATEVRLNSKRKKVVKVHPLIKAKGWASFGLQTAAILGLITYGAPALVTAASLTAISMVLNTDAANEFLMNLYNKGLEAEKEGKEPHNVIGKLKERFNGTLRKIKDNIVSHGGAYEDGEEEIETMDEIELTDRIHRSVENYYARMR